MCMYVRIHVFVHICMYISMYVHRMQKNLMPKLRESDTGDQYKLYCQGTVCWRCVLTALRTVQLGLAEVGNQAKPQKYSGEGGRETKKERKKERKKENCISYQFRADVQTYGHRPRHTANNDGAEIDVSIKTARLPPRVRCCLNDMDNKTVFIINWRHEKMLYCGPIGRCPFVWGPVTWKSKSQASPDQSCDRCKWRWGILGHWRRAK
jgi:hypothetical protein